MRKKTSGRSCVFLIGLYELLAINFPDTFRFSSKCYLGHPLVTTSSTSGNRYLTAA